MPLVEMGMDVDEARQHDPPAACKPRHTVLRRIAGDDPRDAAAFNQDRAFRQLPNGLAFILEGRESRLQ